MESFQEQRELCCTLCCNRHEAEANGREVDEEIDRFLELSGAGRSPLECQIYSLSAGWCPLIDSAPRAISR